jgi:integrase
LLLAFDCYLRVGEWLALRREDVLVPGPGGPAHALVVIRNAKTGNGQPQVVVINRPVVVLLLRLVLRRTRAGERLFPYVAPFVRHALGDSSVQLGLPRFRPHGLRHGGASQDFDDGVDMSRIIVRGRWAVERSARRYIHVGYALLFDVHRFRRQAQLGSALEQHLVQLFTGAPL